MTTRRYRAVAEPARDGVRYYCATDCEDDPCVVAFDRGDGGPLVLSYGHDFVLPVEPTHARRARAAVAAYTRRTLRELAAADRGAL